MCFFKKIQHKTNAQHINSSLLSLLCKIRFGLTGPGGSFLTPDEFKGEHRGHQKENPLLLPRGEGLNGTPVGFCPICWFHKSLNSTACKASAYVCRGVVCACVRAACLQKGGKEA